ncbi:hypothetical protein [Lacticaseibacillus saniviri]
MRVVALQLRFGQLALVGLGGTGSAGEHVYVGSGNAFMLRCGATFWP